jgi:hypothetical protein
MNSRQKGKRVERLWRDQLREAGFLKAFRGQQYCGSAGNADVVCPELPTIHFEVKGVQNLNVLAMLAADWLRLVRDSDWVSPTEDPQTSPATTSSVNYDVVPPRSPRLVDCPMTSSNSSSPASEHR